MIYRLKMVKSKSVVYLICITTIFFSTYDAKNVAQTLGTGSQVTQKKQSVQDLDSVADSVNENGQVIFVPPVFPTEFDASNRSKWTLTDEIMKEYLSSMIASPKAQQKIKAADGDKMYEAFSEAKLPDTIVGVYEGNQNGRYKRLCSGAILNYFHVITAASCVWNESTSQVKDPSSFLVIAGRTAFPGEVSNGNLEPGEQRFNVTHLLVPKTFTGTAGNSQSDLAVVRLGTVVNKTDSVDFSRVDWDNDFSEEPNSGVQEGLFMDSENALEDGIRYVNVSSWVDPENEVNITSSDKRCARFTEAKVSSVNFGAPLLVYHPHTSSHYLRGVLSWTYSDHGQRVVEFTDISDEKTLRWINNAATGLFDPPANYRELTTGFYRWNNQNQTWLEAKAICESDGNYSYLAFPTKDTEYFDITLLTNLDGPMRAFWVGFSDRDKEGDIVSLFGINVDNYEYAHWLLDTANMTKNEEDADCVMSIIIEGENRPGLVTSSCDERRPFICGFCLECALLDSAFGETQGVSRYLAQGAVE